MTSAPGTGKYIQAHQRITFLFQEQGQRLLIAHIHHSMDYTGVADGELFPVKAGQAAYQKLQATLEEKDRQIELMLTQMPGGMAICLGRLREDPVMDYKFVCLSHNTLRGAAGGGVLSAEYLCKLGYIPHKAF